MNSMNWQVPKKRRPRIVAILRCPFVQRDESFSEINCRIRILKLNFLKFLQEKRAWSPCYSATRKQWFVGSKSVEIIG